MAASHADTEMRRGCGVQEAGPHYIQMRKIREEMAEILHITQLTQLGEIFT
jgi:hypothetical protein